MGRGIDDMEKKGNEEVGLIGTLGLLAAALISASVSSGKKNKEKRRNELLELRNTKMRELQKYKGGFFKEAWNDSEIKKLEKEIDEINQELRNL